MRLTSRHHHVLSSAGRVNHNREVQHARASHILSLAARTGATSVESKLRTDINAWLVKAHGRITRIASLEGERQVTAHVTVAVCGTTVHISRRGDEAGAAGCCAIRSACHREGMSARHSGSMRVISKASKFASMTALIAILSIPIQRLVNTQ